MKPVNMGQSKLIVYNELARIYFKTNGKRASQKDIDEFIQELADDGLNAAIPNEILGLNPRSRISKSLTKKTMPEIYAVDGFLETIHGDNKVMGEKAKKEIRRATVQLVDAVLSNALHFKLYATGKDKTDANLISDFEALQKKGNKRYDEEKIDAVNKLHMTNNIIRNMFFIYISASLFPLLSLTKDDLYQMFKAGGIGDIPLKDLYKQNTIVKILRYPLKTFNTLFLKFNLKSIFYQGWIEKEAQKRLEKK